MHKRFSYILIPLIALGILLAPISPVFQKNNDGNLVAGVGMNEANATGQWSTDLTADFTANVTANVDSGSAGVTITAIIQSKTAGDYSNIGKQNGIVMSQGVNSDSPFILEVSEENNFTGVIQEESINWKTLGYINDGSNSVKPDPSVIDDTKASTITLHKTYGDLSDYGGEPLYARLIMENWSITDSYTSDTVNATDITKPSAATFQVSKNGTTTDNTNMTNSKIFEFGCGVTSMEKVEGCVAGLSYLVFELSSWIAHGMGIFLDFFVYYSTNSTSYTNDFVTQAFAAVRDIANIFFIIALLYVAIKTILDISVSNSKKIIGTIVIVALLINFSLFFTQVIIDSTNILAKVFYNQTTAVDETGKPLPAGAGGQKSISIGLIDKFNPQKILSAGTGGNAQSFYNTTGNKGYYIFISLLASFIVLYAAYVFLMVGLLFVGRVVALWLSMIFAPLAFASYTMPFNIPGFGHKDWWDMLLKNAFLAPIFIFFLYMIVMFAKFLPTIVSYNTNSPDTMQQIMSIVIPFAILVILLMQAKKIAVEFSGEIGKGITGMVKAVGGFVGGAALGATAMVGSGVVGGISSRIAKSNTLIEASEKKGLGGWAARRALGTANTGAKATFDLRKTGVGGALGKGMGMNFQSAKGIGLGTKEGGYKGETERRNKKNMEEFETHKTTMTNDQVKDWAKENDKKDADGNLFTTSEQLNNYRMKNFNDNIGKTGLISSMAYTAVNAGDAAIGLGQTAGLGKVGLGGQTIEQKAVENLKAAGKNTTDPTYQKDLTVETEKIRDSRAQTAKLVIGGTIAAISGGAGAGIGAGLLGGGVTGGIIGGAVGVGLVGGEAMKLEEESRLSRASMGKQIRTLENLETRISELTKSLDGYNDLLEKGNDILKDDDGQPIKSAFVTGDKERGFEVDQTKVEEALANLAVIGKREDLKLKKLIEDGGDTREVELKLIQNVTETAKLNRLKTAVKDMNGVKNQLYTANKDKKMETTPTKKDSGSTSKPSTPPPATQAATK